MKYTSAILIAFIITACKTGEGIDNERSQLRTDGFYMGRNINAFTRPDTVNGILIPKNVVELLRFYSPDSGVIIPETVRQDFVMTDSASHTYFNWCRDYENKNPADKDFVNFKCKLYSNDSIRFSQTTANTRIDYIGKIYKDSIALQYTLKPLGVGIGNAPAKALCLRFYAAKM